MVSFSTPIPASDAGADYSLPSTASFTLPEFNPALGTLTGVELSFALTYQGEVDVLNFSQFFGPPTAEPFTDASLTIPIDMSTPSGLLAPLVMAAYSGVSGIAAPVYPNTTNFLGPPTAMTPTFTPGMGDFPLYTGVTTNLYTLSYGTGMYMGSGTDVAFGGDGNSYGTATVTFTYTPEPSSLVLLGLGAMALAGKARRRMRARAA